MPSVGRQFNPYKIFIGSFIPNGVLQHKELSSTAKLCWAKLAQYSGKKGECCPRQETLAKDIGVSVRHVIRALQELESQGFIRTIKPDGQARFLHKPNKYIFLWHPCLEFSLKDDVTSGDDKDVTSEDDETVISGDDRDVTSNNIVCSLNESEGNDRLPPKKQEAASLSSRSPLSPPGALPQTPTPSPDRPAPLPQDGKSVEVMDNSEVHSVHHSSQLTGESTTGGESTPGGATTKDLKGIVGVWAKRLSMVPGIRGPGQAKRRQWAGELEQWVKDDGGLAYQEILDVLIFAMEDPFWRSRIISPKALRRHWDTLVAQRSAKGAEADVEEVLNEFGRAYEAARGKRYIFQCKDRFKARELLNQMGKEEIIGLFKRFFEVDDPFLDKQGRSFSCFAGQINRLRGSNSGSYYVPFEEFLKEKARRKAKEGGADGKGGDTTEGRDGGGVAVGCDTS